MQHVDCRLAAFIELYCMWETASKLQFEMLSEQIYGLKIKQQTT